MANSFASLSTVIAWGSLIFAVMLFVVGLAWGKMVTQHAEKEVREDAKRCAEKWFAEEAPAIMRQFLENITGPTLTGNDGNDADEIGEHAG